MAFGGFTRPPTRIGALFEGIGATGLAAVLNTPPSTPPSTPPIWPPGTPPGTPPATPPKLSESRGASFISAICFGMTVGAKSLPPLMNLARDGATLTSVVAGGGGGGGGGGATSSVWAYCLMLIVSVKNRPKKIGMLSTTTWVTIETASFQAREPVLRRFSSIRTACENLNAGLISR